MTIKNPHLAPHAEILKTITIKKIDKKLFDRYSSLSKLWGRNIGFSFSLLIGTYNKEFPVFLERSTISKNQSKTEKNIIIIDYLKKKEEKLIVSRNDLIDAGENFKYHFKNIKDLVFADSVDNELLMKHVYRIRNCNVKMSNAISPLLLHSLIRSKIEYSNSIDNQKDITIRNVDAIAYDKFVSSCKTNNQKIGEAVNDLLVKFIPEIEIFLILAHDFKIDQVDVLIITSLDEFIVNSNDIECFKDRKILFHRINKLQFLENVTKDQFFENILGIYDCKNVTLSSSIPRLMGYSKIKEYL